MSIWGFLERHHDMSTKFLAPNRYRDHALLLLRLVAGLLFFQAGAMKLFGWYGGMPGGAHVELASQVGIGAILEVAGGIAIAAGLFTRPIAFVLAGEMAVAYWQFHAPGGRMADRQRGPARGPLLLPLPAPRRDGSGTVQRR